MKNDELDIEDGCCLGNHKKRLRIATIEVKDTYRFRATSYRSH